MLGEITSIIGALKNAIDIGKQLKTSTSDQDTNEQLGKMLSSVNDAMILLNEQTAILFDLQRENRELLQKEASISKELAALRVAHHDLLGYVPFQLAPGVVVYVRREFCDGQNDAVHEQVEKAHEPKQYICPQCYQDKKKGVLNYLKKDFDGTHYKCLLCDAVFINHQDRAEVGIATVRRTKSEWDSF